MTNYLLTILVKLIFEMYIRGRYTPVRCIEAKSEICDFSGRGPTAKILSYIKKYKTFFDLI